MPKADDRRRGVVDVLVELLGPQPHFGTAVGILRRERRVRIGLLEIFEDDVGFRHDIVAVDQGRHHGAAIELEVPRLLVLARAQYEMAILPRKPLFGEADPHLLRAERHVVVIQSKHMGDPGL